MINKILLFISIILFIVIICIILYLLLNQKTHHKKSVYNVTHSEKKYFTDIKCKNFNSNGSSIPSDFLLGLSTAAYQIEGGQGAGGKGLTNWDTYLFSGVANLSTSGQFATNFYYAWKDDIINSGAKFIDKPCVIDGNLITSPHYKYVGEWMKCVVDFYNKKHNL